MNEIVRWKDWKVQYYLALRHWDEPFMARLNASLADIAERRRRVERGEITSDEAFPRDDLEAMLRRLHDEHPEWPHKYKLPKRWHWCGPWNSDS